MATTSAPKVMDLGPDPIDICITREDNVPMSFRMQDSDGVDINITGRSYLFTVDTRDDPPDNTTQVFQLVGTEVSPICLVEPAQADNDLDPDVEYFFDLQETSPTVRTVAKGKYIVGHQITQ